MLPALELREFKTKKGNKRKKKKKSRNKKCTTINLSFPGNLENNQFIRIFFLSPSRDLTGPAHARHIHRRCAVLCLCVSI